MPHDPWGIVQLGLAVNDALDPVPPRLRKVLEAAEDEGWKLGKTGCTLVLRLHRPGDDQALPFYLRWDLTRSKEGRQSWRFHSALAQNGQRMNYNDVFEYLADPSVIYPDPPDSI